MQKNCIGFLNSRRIAGSGNSQFQNIVGVIKIVQETMHLMQSGELLELRWLKERTIPFASERPKTRTSDTNFPLVSEEN